MCNIMVLRLLLLQMTILQWVQLQACVCEDTFLVSIHGYANQLVARIR